MKNLTEARLIRVDHKAEVVIFEYYEKGDDKPKRLEIGYDFIAELYQRNNWHVQLVDGEEEGETTTREVDFDEFLDEFVGNFCFTILNSEI